MQKFLLLFLVTLTVMSGAIIAPALPSITSFFISTPFHETLSKLVLTMPALTIALTAPISGRFVDRFGRKPILLWSLFLYGVLGSAGLWIASLELLLVSRALFGVTVAGVMNSSTALIADLYQGSERSKMIGLQGSFMALGGVLYLNLGGILADISWRGPFAVYLLALIFIPFVYRLIPKVTIQTTSTSPPPSTTVLQDIFRFPYLIIFGVALFAMMIFYFIPLQVPYLLTERFNISNSLIGFMVSIATIFGATISFFYNSIKARISYTWVFILSCIVLGLGHLFLHSSTSLWIVAIGLIISGLGSGLFMPNANLWLLNITPEKRRGQYIGLLTGAIFLGQFLTPFLVNLLIFLAGKTSLFLTSFGLLLVTALFLFLIRNRLDSTT